MLTVAATQTLADVARAARVCVWFGPNARRLLRPRIAPDASAMTDVDTMPSAGSLGRVVAVRRRGSRSFVISLAGSSIGFSSLLSLGASLDLDFGELLDYFTFGMRRPPMCCSTLRR